MVGAFDIVVVDDVDVFDVFDVPPELVDEIVNVYAVFGVNPDTSIGEVEPIPVKPPGLLVTVFFEIVPLPPEAVKATLIAVVLKTVVADGDGAPGFVVIGLDATEGIYI
jgi:hypothetical protein